MSTETKTKHPAEPWTVGTHYPSDITSGGVKIAEAGCALLSDGDVDATAARIVACVNACAGMEDPAKVMERARGFLSVIASYAQRRDADAATKHMALDASAILRALGG